MKIEEILDIMVDGTPYNVSRGLENILTNATPEEFFKVAMKEYELSPYEGRLSIIVWVMENFGIRAWPILRVCNHEAFVGPIANMKDVPAIERKLVLLNMMHVCEPIDVFRNLVEIDEVLLREIFRS